jgi:hypothetical protein
VGSIGSSITTRKPWADQRQQETSRWHLGVQRFSLLPKQPQGGGLAMGEEMTAEPVGAALNMALATRKPDSVIHHSDQGSHCKEMASGPRWAQWAMPTTTR